jgi:hypothetical protein
LFLGACNSVKETRGRNLEKTENEGINSKVAEFNGETIAYFETYCLQKARLYWKAILLFPE